MIYWRFPPDPSNQSPRIRSSVSVEYYTRLPYELYVSVRDTLVSVKRNRDLNYEQVRCMRGRSASNRKVDYELRTGRNLAELACKDGEMNRNSSVNSCVTRKELRTGQARHLTVYRHCCAIDLCVAQQGRKRQIYLTFGPTRLTISGAVFGFLFWQPPLLISESEVDIDGHVYPLKIQ